MASTLSNQSLSDLTQVSSNICPYPIPKASPTVQPTPMPGCSPLHQLFLPLPTVEGLDLNPPHPTLSPSPPLYPHARMTSTTLSHLSPAEAPAGVLTA